MVSLFLNSCCVFEFGKLGFDEFHRIISRYKFEETVIGSTVQMRFDHLPSFYPLAIHSIAAKAYPFIFLYILITTDKVKESHKFYN